jgi:hypothetical protein
LTTRRTEEEAPTGQAYLDCAMLVCGAFVRRAPGEILISNKGHDPDDD